MTNRDEDELRRYVGCVYQFEPLKRFKSTLFLTNTYHFSAGARFGPTQDLVLKKIKRTRVAILASFRTFEKLEVWKARKASRPKA